MTLTLIASGYGLSAMGDEMLLVVLTLRLYGEGRPGVAISALVIAGVLPMVLLAPVVGTVVDRFESTRLIAVVLSLQAILVAALAFVDGLGITLLLVALIGVGLALVSPALALLVPAVVGEDRVPAGYARLELFRTTGTIGGPALAGVLIAFVGERAVLLCDALSFVVMAVLIATLKVRRFPDASQKHLKWRDQVRQGSGLIRKNAVLRVAVPTLATAIVFTAVLTVARVYFSQEQLRAGDLGYGLLVAAHLAGMTIAAAFVAPRIPIAKQTTALVTASVAMGAALLAAGSFGSYVLAFASFLLTGVCNTVQGLAIRNLVHAEVPSHMRGRAFASSGAMLNSAHIIGTGLGGPLSSAFGGGHALQLAGAGTLAVGLVAIPLLLRAGMSIGHSQNDSVEEPLVGDQQVRE
ncbi:putative MFS family arabinose efflux permease [Lentzea atacamensis]|uniref:Multidrug efflux pump Tap n=1 Tax=Lentzea atacamensis TaxID=531938 RepID=A0ABX9E7B6_9PSEU|nr:MFS transporter [Lentzea atacamensis]RAS64672.1 putative MFS family arabinose efflux permease [Lentzea atacamensis]